MEPSTENSDLPKDTSDKPAADAPEVNVVKESKNVRDYKDPCDSRGSKASIEEPSSRKRKREDDMACCPPPCCPAPCCPAPCCPQPCCPQPCPGPCDTAKVIIREECGKFVIRVDIGIYEVKAVQDCKCGCACGGCC